MLPFNYTQICIWREYLLCNGGKTPPNESPGYNAKQSDTEVPVMLDLWGMRSTPSLPLVTGPLRPKW